MSRAHRGQLGDPAGEMPLTQHLAELRARLISASPDYNVLVTRLRIHAEEVS